MSKEEYEVVFVRSVEGISPDVNQGSIHISCKKLYYTILDAAIDPKNEMCNAFKCINHSFISKLKTEIAIRRSMNIERMSAEDLEYTGSICVPISFIPDNPNADRMIFSLLASWDNILPTVRHHILSQILSLLPNTDDACARVIDKMTKETSESLLKCIFTIKGSTIDPATRDMHFMDSVYLGYSDNYKKCGKDDGSAIPSLDILLMVFLTIAKALWESECIGYSKKALNKISVLLTMPEGIPIMSATGVVVRGLPSGANVAICNHEHMKAYIINKNSDTFEYTPKDLSGRRIIVAHATAPSLNILNTGDLKTLADIDIIYQTYEFAIKRPATQKMVRQLLRKSYPDIADMKFDLCINWLVFELMYVRHVALSIELVRCDDGETCDIIETRYNDLTELMMGFVHIMVLEKKELQKEIIAEEEKHKVKKVKKNTPPPKTAGDDILSSPPNPTEDDILSKLEQRSKIISESIPTNNIWKIMSSFGVVHDKWMDDQVKREVEEIK